MTDLKGKVALVTGSARGIGKTIILELARNGCNVIVSDIDKDSPAARSELKVGDIIVEINNEKISDFRSVKSLIEDIDLKPGDTMVLKVFRKRRYYTINVKLERPPRKRRSR